MVFNTSTEARWTTLSSSAGHTQRPLPPGRAAGRLTVRGPAGTRELAVRCAAPWYHRPRKAKVDDLNLEAAGVRLGKDRVQVDEYLRTSNTNIFAAGDVAFPEKIHPRGYGNGRGYASPTRWMEPIAQQGTCHSHCTYTDPEVAQVGLTPRRAREEGVPIDAYRLELAKVERAFLDGEEEGVRGFTRAGAVVRIVGATLVGRAMPVK